MHIDIDFDTIPISYKLYDNNNVLIKTGEINDAINFIFKIIDSGNEDVFIKTKKKKAILKSYELLNIKKITIKEKNEK